MQYDDKLITLDNLGTFKGKMEGEIDKASHDLIADEYDATKTYNVGDVVLHGGFLYECSTAIAQAEEWDPTKWTQINLAEYCRNVAKIGYIELSGRSGSLTDAQIAELKKPECIAKLVRDSNTTYIFSSRLVSTLSNLCQFIYTDIGSSAISVNYTKLYLTCRYDAKTYQLTTDAKSLYWKEQIDTLLENTIASQYSSSETYDVGDYCLYKPQYDWKLYRCTTAVTVAESFDSNKWEEVKVTELGGEGVKYVEVVNADFTSMTDEHATEVENADVLVYNGTCYQRYSAQSTLIEFVKFTLDNNGDLWKNIIQYDTTSSPKRIGGNYSHINIASVYKIANDFSSSQSYVVGDLVWHNYTLYRCIVAHSGAWVADDFQQVNVSQAIQASALTNGKMVKTIPNNNTFSAQDLEDIKNELVVAIEDSNRYIYLRCPQRDTEGYKGYSTYLFRSSGYMQVGYAEDIKKVNLSTGVVSNSGGWVPQSASKPLTTGNINSGTPTEVVGFDSSNALVRGAAPSVSEDEVEVVAHADGKIISEEQLQKAKEGKLIISSTALGSSNPIYMTVERVDSQRVYFHCSTPYSEAGSNVEKQMRDKSPRCSIQFSNRSMSTIGTGGWPGVADSADNFFASNVAPTSDGKKIVREQNIYGKIIPTYSSSDAGKVVRVNSSGTGVELDETATELEINRLFRTKYTITSTITNGSASGDKSIWVDETASVTITPSSGYVLPTTITVSGATYSYDNSTGIVSLSAATGAVSITAICPPPPPNKGDIITLDGGTARYRVLKTNGNVAEVFALDNITNLVFNDSSVTTTFSDGSTGQKYEGSNLDTYMNSTFYNSLSANIKNAIVQKAIIQSMYQYAYTGAEITGYDFAIAGLTSGNPHLYEYKRKGQVSVGNRYCYALDLDDVAEYLGAGNGNTVSGSDLNNMFFEQTTVTSRQVWLASADSVYPADAFYVYGSDGRVHAYSYNHSSSGARPAFQVDLSKVSWSKE